MGRQSNFRTLALKNNAHLSQVIKLTEKYSIPQFTNVITNRTFCKIQFGFGTGK